MARLRFHDVRATLGASLGDDPDVDTTITFAEKLTSLAGDVPTIASPDYMVLRVGDEIVHVTAYTAEATSATVVRGQEGTAVSSHASPASVQQVASPQDFRGGADSRRAVGDGAGNHTTTSSTFALVHASMYTLSIPAQEGDVLALEFSCQWFHNTLTSQCRVRFLVGGTAAADLPTIGLMSSAQRADTSIFNTFAWMHTVEAGDISDGEVEVAPQFATNGGTLTLRNDGTNGRPTMRVVNLGPLA